MVAPMRHHNSPEERAKREAAPEGDEQKSRRGFMHYNHPDEIAKRERAGEPARAVVVPNPGRVLAATPPPSFDEWASTLGQENTAPAPRREVLALSHTPERPKSPAALTAEQRLEQLEHFVYALLDDPSEAREFRMLLSNQAAVTESQRDMIGRVRALERTLEQLAADDDEPVDDAPVDDAPVDTVDPAELEPFKACTALHPLMGEAAGVCGLLEGHGGRHTWEPPAASPDALSTPPTEPTT